MRAARALLSAGLLGALLIQQASPAQAPYDPERLELRGGYLVSIALPFLETRLFPERGSSNLNVELVLPKFWRMHGRLDALLPRVHIGGTASLDRGTSYVYAGALWTFDYTPRNFLELSVGGMIHDGELVGSAPHLAELGCRRLFEFGVNMGYRMSSQSSMMLSFDHGSNARHVLSDCPSNEGLNLLGLRFGYRF